MGLARAGCWGLKRIRLGPPSHTWDSYTWTWISVNSRKMVWDKLDQE